MWENVEQMVMLINNLFVPKWYLFQWVTISYELRTSLLLTRRMNPFCVYHAETSEKINGYGVLGLVSEISEDVFVGSPSHVIISLLVTMSR